MSADYVEHLFHVRHHGSCTDSLLPGLIEIYQPNLEKKYFSQIQKNSTFSYFCIILGIGLRRKYLNKIHCITHRIFVKKFYLHKKKQLEQNFGPFRPLFAKIGGRTAIKIDRSINIFTALFWIILQNFLPAGNSVHGVRQTGSCVDNFPLVSTNKNGFSLVA